MQKNINIPKNIEDDIGYSAWTALSWALQCHWVQDYKWLFSERLGRDVGVPETVDRILAPSMNPHILSDIYSANKNLLSKYGLDAFKKIEEHAFSHLLATKDILSRSAFFLFQDRCEGVNPKQLRDLMIEGYLLGTDFVSPLWVRVNGELEHTGIVSDAHGANQLEGELRRYWAKINEIDQPAAVKITSDIVEHYCIMQTLSEDISKKLIEKSGL